MKTKRTKKEIKKANKTRTLNKVIKKCVIPEDEKEEKELINKFDKWVKRNKIPMGFFHTSWLINHLLKFNNSYRTYDRAIISCRKLKKPSVFLSYTFIKGFAEAETIGIDSNIHQIEIFSFYSKAKGLYGVIEKIETSSIELMVMKLKRKYKIGKAQENTLFECADNKLNSFINKKGMKKEPKIYKLK